MPLLYLFISYSGAFGGAERVLVEVAGSVEVATSVEGAGSVEVADSGEGAGSVEVCIACPPGPLADAARRHGLRVLALRSRSLALRGQGGRVRDAVTRGSAALALLGHQRELARLATDLDPDVIALWGTRSTIAWGLWRGSSRRRRARPSGDSSRHGRARVVIAHHDLLPTGAAIAWLVRAAAARSDSIVVNSLSVADDLDPAGALGARLSVIYPGVDPAPSDWPDGPPVAVVIGALVQWKRVDLALEAIALARRSVPSLRLRAVAGPAR